MALIKHANVSDSLFNERVVVDICAPEDVAQLLMRLSKALRE